MATGEENLKEQIFRLISEGNVTEILSLTRYRRVIYKFLGKYYSLFKLVQQIENLEYIPKSFLNKKNSDILIISTSVWGSQYIDLFEKIFLTSFMPNSVLKEVAKSRNILFNIYTPTADAQRIRKITSNIENITVNVIDIGKNISSAISIKDPSFRYYIYGALHNADLMAAKKIAADFLPISPDNVHSKGSFLNYLKYLDLGYKVVLVSGIRVQREAVIGEILSYRDESLGELNISASELVRISANNIHHEFRRYFLFDKNDRVPELMSLRIIPKSNGFVMNSYHLHPILISKEQLKEISHVDYLTVDAGLIKKLGIELKDYDKKIKVIESSEDACMADLSKIYEGISLEVFQRRIYSSQHADEMNLHYSDPINCWAFKKDIHYQSNNDVKYRSFDNVNGVLVCSELN